MLLHSVSFSYYHIHVLTVVHLIAELIIVELRIYTAAEFLFISIIPTTLVLSLTSMAENTRLKELQVEIKNHGAKIENQGAKIRRLIDLMDLRDQEQRVHTNNIKPMLEKEWNSYKVNGVVYATSPLATWGIFFDHLLPSFEFTS